MENKNWARYCEINAKLIPGRARKMNMSDADYLIKWLGDPEVSTDALAFLGINIIKEKTYEADTE